MRHLRIKNFGPIQEADIDLGQINVIIGQQSSGKSCVLKTACYCAWVEKRIELTQNSDFFSVGSSFIDMMAAYYNMTGYIRKDTHIEYETNHLAFVYDNSELSFRMKWKPGRWNYRRPKVSYVPADRNLVAAIPGWSSLKLDENLLEFMANWDKARRFIGKEENILGLGMSYLYDRQSNTDRIQLTDGQPLMLKESSSGIQSLIPMFVHLDYMTDGLYNDNGSLSYEQKEEQKYLLAMLIDRFSRRKDPKYFRRIYERFVHTDHSEIFLEEPEDNLFPPTQC